jgi:ABC-2 type transport system ATP-binding protein
MKKGPMAPSSFLLPLKGPPMSQTSIECQGLCKSYGAHSAVAGIDLAIAEGEFFGLLGRNGSGKTSTLHMLATLVRPTAGRAIVAGHDVVRQPVAVRRAIGMVFQDSALDRNLSVEENLHFAAALYDLPPDVSRGRIDELLRLFELADRRRALVGNLSGGMRRALDIARGVLHRPRVLLLDEPTIGLDVINRRTIWRFLDRLRQETGLTLVLTTHYLEEAATCNRVVFMSKGRFIGSGEPSRLIAELGSQILDIESNSVSEHAEILQPLLGPPIIEGDHLQFRVAADEFSVGDVQRRLQPPPRAFSIRQPDLNDVYVWLNHRHRAARP